MGFACLLWKQIGFIPNSESFCLPFSLLKKEKNKKRPTWNSFSIFPMKFGWSHLFQQEEEEVKYRQNTQDD